MTGRRPDAEGPGLACEVVGPAGGPVVLLVHGTRLSRGMWAAQMRDLSDAYRVIAVDLPGHGALAHMPFTLEAASTHLAEVIETVGGGRAVVVGLSLGGYAAMDLASRRPELVRGLVLSGATAEPVGWRGVPYTLLAWLLERDRGRQEALNAWFFRWRFPPAIAEPIVAGGFWFEGGAAALRSLVGQSFVPRLRAYDGPTLLINGHWDLPFRLSAGAFARAARHPRQVRLAGASHLANLDRPAAFNDAIRRFMRSLDEPS